MRGLFILSYVSFFLISEYSYLWANGLNILSYDGKIYFLLALCWILLFSGLPPNGAELFRESIQPYVESRYKVYCFSFLVVLYVNSLTFCIAWKMIKKQIKQKNIKDGKVRLMKLMEQRKKASTRPIVGFFNYKRMI